MYLAGAVLAALAAAALLCLQRRRWPHLWADLAFLLRALLCRRRLLRAAGPGGCSLAQRVAVLARAAPERPFLRFEERRWSYGQAERASRRVANALRAWRGPGGPLRPGQTVALLVGNEPAFVWAWLGLAKLGVAPAFLGTGLRRRALLHCLRGCGARALLVARDLWEAVEALLPTLQELGIVVWVLGHGPCPPGVTNLQELVEEASEEPVPWDLSTPSSMTDTCLYIFTSGTTGMPKAARVSHLKSIMCLGFYHLVGASSRDVIYVALPLYHMSGSLLGIVGCIGLGATCVLKRKFSASQFWDDCQRYQVTVLQYIGELCRYLINQPKRDGERNHSLRLAVGSGLRPDVWREFLQRFGAVHIVETYGMTEGNVTFFNYTGTPGAVGRGSFLYKLFSPFELVRYDVLRGAPVRDAAGRCQRVSPGETGLLISPVTPQSPFLGYAGRRELSEQKLLRDVFAPGDTYFNTGDLMAQDAAQFVYFRDRTGDTYRWKGENVATTEVAEALAALDSLQEVNVYGVTVPGYEGRAGMAAIVLQPGCELDGVRLYSHVVEFLPPYARPRFLRVQDRLAMTHTFKQHKVHLASEGCDPRRLPDPLYLLDDASQSYVPLSPRLWEGVLSGAVRI